MSESDAGAEDGGAVGVECPDVICPTCEETVCEVCDSEEPVDCEEPTDSEFPVCEDGWICKHKVLKDKQRLVCWCGNVPGGFRE